MLSRFRTQGAGHITYLNSNRLEAVVATMSKGGARDLQRIIAASSPANASSCTSESLALVRAKFEQMASLSQNDRHIIAAIQQRMLEQRHELTKRQATTRALQDRFEALAAVSRADREAAEALRATAQHQSDEIDKIRAEKSTLASLNEALRQELNAKREAYAAAVSRCNDAEGALQAKSRQVRALQDAVARYDADQAGCAHENRRLSDANRAQEAQARDLQDRLHLLEQKLADADKRADAAEQRTRDTEAVLATRGQDVDRLKSELEAVRRDECQVRDQLRREQQSVADRDVLIEQLDGRLRQNDVKMQELVAEGEARDRDAQAGAGELRAQLNAARTEIADLTTRQAASAAELRDLHSRCDAERARAECLIAERDEVAKDLDAARKAVAECHRANVILQETDASARERIRQLESIVAYNAEQAARVKADIDELRSQVEARDRDVERLAHEKDARQRESDARVARLTATETEVRIAVAKLLNAQEAMEGSFTCLSCMTLLTEAKTCVPCGHVVCGTCCTDGGACSECARPVTGVVPNRNMSALSGKFTYIRQVLGRLKDDLTTSPLFADIPGQ